MIKWPKLRKTYIDVHFKNLAPGNQRHQMGIVLLVWSLLINYLILYEARKCRISTDKFVLRRRKVAFEFKIPRNSRIIKLVLSKLQISRIGHFTSFTDRIQRWILMQLAYCALQMYLFLSTFRLFNSTTNNKATLILHLMQVSNITIQNFHLYSDIPVEIVRHYVQIKSLFFFQNCPKYRVCF